MPQSHSQSGHCWIHEGLSHKATGSSGSCAFATRSPFATGSFRLRTSRSGHLGRSQEVGENGSCRIGTTALVCATASRTRSYVDGTRPRRPRFCLPQAALRAVAAASWPDGRRSGHDRRVYEAVCGDRVDNDRPGGEVEAAAQRMTSRRFCAARRGRCSSLRARMMRWTGKRLTYLPVIDRYGGGLRMTLDE